MNADANKKRHPVVFKVGCAQIAGVHTAGITNDSQRSGRTNWQAVLIDPDVVSKLGAGPDDIAGSTAQKNSGAQSDGHHLRIFEQG